MYLVDITFEADLGRGRYLCELCHDMMTDDVLLASESPTGEEIACCPRCRLAARGD